MSSPGSFARGQVVVVVGGGAEALAAARAHTPQDAPVLELGGGDDAAAAVAPADLVLVAGDVRVGPGWLAPLRAAAGEDGTVATAAAVAVTDGTPPVRPDARARARAPEPVWGCTLVTRAALDLAGPLDDGFGARCSALGLLHVVAGDAVVTAEGPSAAAPAGEREPVARLRRRAQKLADGISVTVDARILRDPLAGTQVHTLELLAALHRTGAVRLRALLPPNPTPVAAELLDRLDGLERLDSDDLDDRTPATAIVHRPYQVSSALDLLTLRQVGEQLVVTHQDLLGYHNPAYHADRATWEAYRRLTRTALTAAYAVLAFSEHAAADLRKEELVDAGRLRVALLGVDHTLHELVAQPRPPERAEELASAPYLLCIGTDLRHKNRPFAFELLRELRRRHGWDGRLVLAGVHVSEGSSAADEAAWRDRHPELADAIVDAGAPDESEKAWLYANAAAVVYPTTYEGFGLIPFEAAEHGTPCLFAPQASLAELLPGADRLVPWDAQASADRAIGVLREDGERERLLEAVRAAAGRLTWDAYAATLLETYADALLVRPDAASWVALAAEAERREWEHRYWELFHGIGPTGLSLVGEGALLPEPAQRSLAALARRPLTRRPLLAALGALQRVGGR
jgi:glycosyltransferase involved in cell wall biosynthesis